VLCAEHLLKTAAQKRAKKPGYILALHTMELVSKNSACIKLEFEKLLLGNAPRLVCA
jgi:hypothetical protein